MSGGGVFGQHGSGWAEDRAARRCGETHREGAAAGKHPTSGSSKLTCARASSPRDVMCRRASASKRYDERRKHVGEPERMVSSGDACAGLARVAGPNHGRSPTSRSETAASWSPIRRRWLRSRSSTRSARVAAKSRGRRRYKAAPGVGASGESSKHVDQAQQERSASPMSRSPCNSRATGQGGEGR